MQIPSAFGADPVGGVGIGVRFVSVHYLLNQLMNFYQTCIDTLLGGWNEYSDFGDLDLIFKVTAAL